MLKADELRKLGKTSSWSASITRLQLLHTRYLSLPVAYLESANSREAEWQGLRSDSSMMILLYTISIFPLGTPPN
jgi:hypothetical protein